MQESTARREAFKQLVSPHREAQQHSLVTNSRLHESAIHQGASKWLVRRSNIRVRAPMPNGSFRGARRARARATGARRERRRRSGGPLEGAKETGGTVQYLSAQTLEALARPRTLSRPPQKTQEYRIFCCAPLAGPSVGLRAPPEVWFFLGGRGGRGRSKRPNSSGQRSQGLAGHTFGHAFA